MLQLRDYQREDVEIIKAKKRIGLFNEQRTGKTPTICVALKELSHKRVVIVCPNSMLYVWKYEYERWTGNKAVIIKKDTQYDKLTKDDAIIMSYGKLSYKNKMDEFPHLERVLKHKPTAFVCDEAHILSNRDTNYNITYITNKSHHRHYYS